MPEEVRCYPGTVLESAHGKAVASAVVGKDGMFFMVTVGHYCDGHEGATVEYLARGGRGTLGTIEQGRFLHDDTYDVGVIRASADCIGRVTLGLSRLGDPYKFARLRELDDLPCHFYLGGVGWRTGVIESISFDMTDKHLLTVRDTMNDGVGADFGHSGSPLYIRGSDGHELVGIYVGREPGGPLRFLHPGPGLGRLGFRLR